MSVWLVVLGLPLVVYLGLAFAPQGRALRGAAWGLAGLTGLAWLLVAADIGGSTVRDGPRGAYVLVGLTGISMALVLGASLRLLRGRVPRDWPGWAWPACVALSLVAIAVPLLRVLYS